MSTATEIAAVDEIRERAYPLSPASTDLDPLIRSVGDARLVLLGEASHGTHEFYRARAEITKRLIREKGFQIVAWEADWPDALQLSRYVQGRSPDRSAVDALDGFERFPVWMWRNADILDLIGWLRAYNDDLPAGAVKVGIFGLDLYSLHSSMNAVVRYLETVDPAAANAARQRYSCFEDFGEDPQSYGLVASADQSLSCEKEAVEQLLELQRKAAEFLSHDGPAAADELFFAEQNARVTRNAEQYYRAMYHGRPNTWNLRDTHMAETLDLLLQHYKEQGHNPKAIVWAHNSHLGDARATSMSNRGELNVGELVRRTYQNEAYSIGFTTYHGTVTAASDWGAAAERKRVRPALAESYEALFHEAGVADFFLPLSGPDSIGLPRWRLERAIGVIYRPKTERWSHYFDADISKQFNAVVHFDETRAVEPL